MLSVITHHIEKLIIRVVSSKMGCDWFLVLLSVIEIMKGIVYNENHNFNGLSSPMVFETETRT